MGFILDPPGTQANNANEQISSLSEWSTRCTRKLNEYLNSSEMKHSSDAKKIASLQAEVDALRTEINTLKSRVASLSTGGTNNG